jgi:competence protein ComEC
MSELNSQKIFSKPEFLLILLIILGYLIFNIPTSKPVNNSQPVIRFFDVGQGDASLITGANGQNILIDGGPNNLVVQKLDKVLGLKKKELSAVIITHPHADHISGLVEVLNKYEVKSVYFTGVVHTAPEYLELLKIIKEKDISTQVVVAGDKLELGVTDEKIEFLYPLIDISASKVENLNDSSIVVRYVYKNRSAIFLGDLEEPGQTELVKMNNGIKSDILKVAHHGSKDSVNKELIKLVDPLYTVITVGKDNKFGHPSKEIIDALSGRNILRTDFNGDIVFYLGQNGELRLDKEK